MFKLTGEDLPLIPSIDVNLAFATRVYDGAEPYSLPPIAKISTFAGRDVPGNAEEVPLDNPDYAGYLFVVTPGFDIGEVISVSSPSWNFNPSPHPLSTSLGGFWVYEDKIYLLGELNQLGISDGLTVNAIALINISVPDDDQNFLIDISEWGDVEISQILVNDILFLPAVNPASPKTKEFKISGDILTLYADTATTPAQLAIAQVFVQKEIDAPIIPSARVAVFDFSEQDLFYLDSISYLGTSFAPPQSPWTPIFGEFFWREPQATLFMTPLTPLTPKLSIRDVPPAKSSVGSISYPSTGG